MARGGDGRGGADASTILVELERLRPLTQLWAITRDISHVVRGGRIPRWAAPLARLTALTPMARIREDGTLGIASVLFARGRAPEVFARRVAGKLAAGTRWRVIMGHCDAPAEGERLLAALRTRLEISESPSSKPARRWALTPAPAL